MCAVLGADTTAYVSAFCSSKKLLQECPYVQHVTVLHLDCGMNNRVEPPSPEMGVTGVQHKAVQWPFWL